MNDNRLVKGFSAKSLNTFGNLKQEYNKFNIKLLTTNNNLHLITNFDFSSDFVRFCS